MSSIQLKSKDKITLIIMGFIGLISIVAMLLNDDAYFTRFWSSMLVNTVFFTIVALMAIFFICISVTAYAGWNAGFKRVWEGMSQFLIVGLILMGIISLGVFFKWHHLYHWADENAVAHDEILQGKSGFLNKWTYLIGGLGILGSWVFFARRMRSLSIKQDDHGDFRLTEYNSMKFWGAIFLPVTGFSSAAAIWLWVMSVDAHWYSTLFGWYTATSCFVSMIALTILLLIFLKSRGYYHNVTSEHFHDLGKFMFAFTVFWTYLWFSQYMLIWYGNIGEETVYFQTRVKEYPILFYGNLVVNFVLPFLILMRNDTKRKYGTLIVVSVLVIFGHWMDLFQMIKPGTLHTAHELSAHLGGAAEHATQNGHEAAAHGHEASNFNIGFTIPGLPEIGLMIGFLALFIATTLHYISKASLVPKNDPFLQESLHHHV
ncbi:MAG: hypothetical protein M3Q56_01555 [Bacteroidota bacterium]|nr:hypothetical protein [Bacteroidota bacterium]